MLFDNNLTGLIQNSVGDNQDNHDEDVRNIRISLEEAGDLAGEENEERDYRGRPLGVITGALEEGIRGFQRRSDLKEDGKILPRGETEKALLLNIKKRTLKDNVFTLMPGGMRVNKDKIMGRLGELLLAKANTQDEDKPKEPKPDRKPDVGLISKKLEELKRKQTQNTPSKPNQEGKRSHAEKQKRYVALSTELNSKQVYLRSLKADIKILFDKYNLLLEALKKAEDKLLLARGAQVLESVMSGGLAKKPLDKIVESGIGFLSKQKQVETAQQKRDRLREKFSIVKKNIADKERYIAKTRESVSNIKQEMAGLANEK